MERAFDSVIEYAAEELDWIEAASAGVKFSFVSDIELCHAVSRNGVCESRQNKDDSVAVICVKDSELPSIDLLEKIIQLLITGSVSC